MKNSLIKQFDLTLDIRNNVLKSLEQEDILFRIPESFNNHILWNAGHLMATHQMLLYSFSGSKERLDADFIKKYAKGTIPEEGVNQNDLVYVKENLIASVNQAKQDYESGYFGEYKSLTTSFGTTLASVEDAVQYIVLHEAMHYGQIKMLEKLLI